MAKIRIDDGDIQKALRESVDVVGRKMMVGVKASALSANLNTIAKTLFLVKDQDSNGDLFSASAELRSPFFWSSLLDRGTTNPAQPRRAKKLAWFADPLRDDPRLKSGYHRTYQDAREAELRLPGPVFRQLILERRLILADVRGTIRPRNFLKPGLREPFANAGEDILAGWMKLARRPMDRAKGTITIRSRVG